MALGIVPNGIKVELNAIQNGIPIVNRMYVTQSTPVGSGDLDDTIVKFLAFFNEYKALCHPTYVLQNITATDVSVANGTQTIFPLTTSNIGTGTGAAMAANAAMVASLRTNFTGRSFRGRFYLGGLNDGVQQDAQNVKVASAGAFAGFVVNLIDTLGTINKTLVVVSNYASGVVRVVALATEIINIIVDTKIDSQRRRTAN